MWTGNKDTHTLSRSQKPESELEKIEIKPFHKSMWKKSYTLPRYTVSLYPIFGIPAILKSKVSYQQHGISASHINTIY